MSKQKVSAAISILNSVWDNVNITSYQTLNTGLHDILRQLILCGVKFDENDYEYIRHYNSGHWLRVSLNGKHMGESLYDAGCIENNSFCHSYEKATGRIPFLIGARRLHECSEFTDKGLYYKVTGWNEDNIKIKVVAYENRRGEWKRKLFEFDRETWLIKRKHFELL